MLSKLKIKKNNFFLVSLHREENLDYEEKLKRVPQILNKLVEEFSLPVIVSTHPRARKKIEMSNFKFSDQVSFLDPFGFSDYCFLQMNKSVLQSGNNGKSSIFFLH